MKNFFKINRALVAEKKLFCLFAALLTVALVGCKKGEEEAKESEPEEIKLAVEPNVINCPAFGGDYIITLTSPASWTATCAESWVKVDPLSGEAGTKEISVKIMASQVSAEMSSKIVFKAGEKTVELPINRAAKEPARLRVTTEKELQTPKDGGTYTVQIESNIKWVVSTNAAWAKIEGTAVKQNNDIVTVTVEPATKPEETKALIIVSPYGGGYEAGQDTVEITRGSTDATSLVIDKTEIKAPSDGGSYSVNVQSNAKWRATKSWEADWLTISSESGEGNGSFGIQVSPATSGKGASTVITVEEVRSDDYKPVQLNILVTREGKPAATLSVDPTSIDVPAEGEQVALNIQCNYPWTAGVIGTNFISISATKGDGNATIVVTVKAATDMNDANGKIIVKSTYGGEQQTIPVHRAGLSPMLILSSNTIYAPASGKEYTIAVTSNTSWRVSTSNSKVATVSTSSGSGNGTFKINVAPATDYNSTTARISVSTADGNITRQVMITRSGWDKSKYVASPISISDTKKVYFSPGNLQYRASNNTWRFAEQQYEFVGNAAQGNVYVKDVKSNNLNISNTYDGWIDLFGWGTGANPTLHTEDGNDYASFTEWGSNRIDYYDVTYAKNKWRTPKKNDWLYILKNRPNAEKLHGNASINGIYGLVILPDNWQFSSALPFTGGTTDYKTNTISIAKWQQMEALGAVFLPMAGWRLGAEKVVVLSGDYWSATLMGSSSSAYAYYLTFTQERIAPQDGGFRYDGYSVRLVQDIE